MCFEFSVIMIKPFAAHPDFLSNAWKLRHLPLIILLFNQKFKENVEITLYIEIVHYTLLPKLHFT